MELIKKLLKKLQSKPDMIRFRVHGAGVLETSAEEILSTEKAQAQLRVLSTIEVPWSPKL